MSSLCEILEALVVRTPGKPFLVFNNKEGTYKDFLSTVKEIAGGLLSAGLKKGDKAAILLPNGLEFPHCWLAANLIEAVMVPVNARFIDPEIEYILGHSEARAVVTSGQHIDTVLSIRERLPLLNSVITVDTAGSLMAQFLWTDCAGRGPSRRESSLRVRMRPSCFIHREQQETLRDVLRRRTILSILRPLKGKYCSLPPMPACILPGPSITWTPCGIQ